MTRQAKTVVIIALMLGMTLAALDTTNVPQGRSFPRLAASTKRLQACSAFR